MELRSLCKRLLALVALIFAVLSLGLPDNVWTGEKLRFGYPTRSADYWPIFVAETKNLFEQEGLNVEVIFIRGAPTVVQILVAGDIDVAGVGTMSAMTAYFKGSPLIMVAGFLNNSPYQIYANPEIKSIKDLKGKPVALGAWSGPPHRAISAVLEASGLDVKRDVRVILIAGSLNRFAALKTKQVVATVLAPPFSSVARKEGFKKLADARDFLKESQDDGIIVRKDFLQKDPEKIRRFVTAIAKAIKFIRSNRKESVAILGRYTKQPQEALEESYELLVPSFSEEINVKGIGSIAAYLKELGIVKEARDLESFIDLRFVSRGR